MFRGLIAVAGVALAAGCETTKPDSTILVGMNADGTYTISSSGGTDEDKAIAALLQSAMNGELDLGSEDEQEPLAEDEVWSNDGNGNLTHIQSGAQCPAQWGDYTRTRTSIFKPDGTDVGCNYGARDGKVRTFYVYKSELSLVDELDGTMETIKTRQPVSTETRFGSGPASSVYMGRSLAYEDADGAKMRTSVVLADGGEWRLKMRLTCEASIAADAENAAGLALMGQSERLDASKPPVPTVKPSPV